MDRGRESVLQQMTSIQQESLSDDHDRYRANKFHEGRRNNTEGTEDATCTKSKTPVEPEDAGLRKYHTWSRLVERYCQLDLTYSKDRLIAIIGLAQVMEVLLHGKYVAGLWAKILPSQLLWRRDDTLSPTVVDACAAHSNEGSGKDVDPSKLPILPHPSNIALLTGPRPR